MVEPTNFPLTDKTTTEKWLTDNAIPFNTVTHDPVPTIAEMLEKVKFENEFAQTKFAKNLFLYDKKKKERMWLVIAAHDTQFQMRSLEKHLKCANGSLRGAQPEFLEQTLGVKGGSVNLFAVVNDPTKKVHLIMDKTLLNDFEYVGFHPMQNDFTTALRKEDLLKIIKLSGRNDEDWTNFDFSTLEGAAEAAADKKKDAPKQKPAKKPMDAEAKKKKELAERVEDAHQLGIEFKKEANFSKWYSQVITKSEMIEYYDVGGCYILRPNAYFIWEQIMGYFDSRIKTLGVKNCYFPMFVNEKTLMKEKDHLEGFSPEVAWVTKSGQSELENPIAIRPTSETIMYPSFAKWIKSHRDLPLLLNQWTNVVRWEFKHPTPFIRTREFLWQEGHTAHATLDDADTFVHKILDGYADVYEHVLACPVVKGRKSEDEKFAGAKHTTTVELYVPVSGRGIQGATSHNLGQNFSKMFEIQFEDRDAQKQLAWQTSWGLSTRSIGAMIMIHSDNKGMVLPPRVAQTQVVIIPILKKGNDFKQIYSVCDKVFTDLKNAGIRVYLDDTDNHNPGFKYATWELRGTPVRVEIGEKDIQANEVRVCVRHDGHKFQASQDTLGKTLTELMDTIHNDMYKKALDARDKNVTRASNWEDFMNALNQKHICLTPWCNRVKCEENVKDRSKEESLAKMLEANEEEVALTGAAKTLCIPYELGNPKLKTVEKTDPDAKNDTTLVDENLTPEDRCFCCGQQAKVVALWGRSY